MYHLNGKYITQHLIHILANTKRNKYVLSNPNITTSTLQLVRSKMINGWKIEFLNQDSTCEVDFTTLINDLAANSILDMAMSIEPVILLSFDDFQLLSNIMQCHNIYFFRHEMVKLQMSIRLFHANITCKRMKVSGKIPHFTPLRVSLTLMFHSSVNDLTKQLSKSLISSLEEIRNFSGGSMTYNQ